MSPSISPFTPEPSQSPFISSQVPPLIAPSPTPGQPTSCGGLVNTLVGGAIGLAVCVGALALCPSMLLLPQALSMPRKLLHHKMSLENLAARLTEGRE